MANFRVTIRYGAPRVQYHVADLSADSLHDAMRRAVEQYPETGLEGADLVEIRRHDEREASPEPYGL